MSCGCDQAITYVSAAPAQSIVLAAEPAAVAVIDNRWADYSPDEIQLEFPALPEADYSCYAPPQVPPGQTRYLKVDEPTKVKQLAQNFDDVRTAVRENNTHIQRNKTNITNVNRNHNHLLRIVTNENNYEHNLTNNVVRVADIHRQKIENVKGETRNFKDFKATQKVEHAGCQKADFVAVAAPTPAPVRVVAATPAPALTVVPKAPSPARGVISVLAPATSNPVQYLETVALSGPTPSLKSVGSQ